MGLPIEWVGTDFVVQIQEETGFQVAAEALQKVTTYNSSVGTSGSLHHMFTVDVDDATPHDGGGGLEYVSLLITPFPFPLFMAICLLCMPSILVFLVFFCQNV